MVLGIPLAPGGLVINELGSVEVRGRTMRSKAANGQSIKVFLLLSLFSPAFLSSLVLSLCASSMCFVARVLHRASTTFDVFFNLEVLAMIFRKVIRTTSRVSFWLLCRECSLVYSSARTEHARPWQPV